MNDLHYCKKRLDTAILKLLYNRLDDTAYKSRRNDMYGKRRSIKTRSRNQRSRNCRW
jgi:hypothetical protein